MSGITVKQGKPVNFDDTCIDIPCPKCGNKMSKSIGWLKNNSQAICDCGATVNLDSNELIEGFSGVENALNNLFKNFKS